MVWTDKINQVWCGDCLELMKEMPDKSIDLIVTDPPFGMTFRSNYRQIKYAKIENDDNLDWLPQVAKELYRVAKENSHSYIFCSFHNIDIFKQKFAGGGWRVKNILIWYKNNTGMGDLEGDYAPQYEMILFITKGNKKLSGGRDSNILRAKKTGNNLHPTEKPEDLIAYLISKSSEVNNLIFDPFMGSWTTARACMDLGRNFIGAELSPEYCEIGKNRLRQQILI